MKNSLKAHWNKTYNATEISNLGWYEAEAVPSLDLIEQLELPKDAPIADIGSGASALIANLLDRGYGNLHALDISEVAIEKAKAQLSPTQAAQVHWIVDDILQPSEELDLENIALWHDRAVFHFLVEEEDRRCYLSVLEKALKPSGYLIIAAFAPHGAEKCTGLPVQRYSAESLTAALGEGFKLIGSMDYTYQMPTGDKRPFVYGCFKKKPT